MSRYIDLLKQSNAAALKSFVTKPRHGLLICAPRGFGANHLANEVAQLIDSNYVTIRPQTENKSNPSIKVATIRELLPMISVADSKLKVFLIEDADRMTSSAQNALLKQLEEPNKNIIFILSTENESVILPTVKSRLETVMIEKISPKRSIEHISKYSLSDASSKQILFLGNGLPRLLESLASDIEVLKSVAATTSDSKTFLSGDRYSKLLIIDKYKNDRLAAVAMIDGCLNILSNTITAQPNKALLETIEHLLDARSKALQNGNVRLILMQLVLK